MKLSEAWLREWVDPRIETAELIQLLTMAGLEVDGVEPAAPEFEGVIIGQIVKVEQHPDADKLRICTVTDGQRDHQVVCGASNAEPDAKVPFARVGATLPEGLVIKQAKLRGIESFGMLCGASELGLDDAVDGLMILPSDAPVGQLLRDWLNLDDAVIEIDLTPNRGDCLSVNGVAREIGVLTSTDVEVLDVVPVSPQDNRVLPVTLSAADYCPRYAGRVISNIDINAKTPLWMREKLRRAELRSIDPVVDVTNYVMIELGQPLHAFDLDKLAHADESHIDVRLAKPGEQITLLDGSEVELDSDMLVIADDNEALAVAGVMGGLSSAVSAKTKNVFLESAFFTPELHAGKARRLGLHTDASHRFERGVDAELQARAMERATQLLLEIVGGTPGPAILVQSEQEQHKAISSEVKLREAQIRRVLGFAIPAEQVVDILTRLGLSPRSVDGGWLVTVPPHRFDIEIEADLLEELARIYGYDALPVEPPKFAMAFSAIPDSSLSTSSIKRHLVAKGYSEAITYSFIEPSVQQLFDPGAQVARLANPIASDMAVMRTGLIPGLVGAAQYNLNRQQGRLKLFETGMGFVSEGADIEQSVRLAGLLCGQRLPESWLSKRETSGNAAQSNVFDFYDLKADVESVLALAPDCLNAISYQANTGANPVLALHPGQSAIIYSEGQRVGMMGLLHPELQQALDLEIDIWVFELQLNLISHKKVPKFKELSKFPEVRRDLAVIVDSDINTGDIVECARRAAGDLLMALVVFDQYSGMGIDQGKQSIGLGLTWQHSERTLKEDEINTFTNEVLASLKQRFNASLR